MTVRIRRRALLALVLAAIAAPGVTARPRRVRPVRLKLEGYVEHAPADTPIVATLTLRHRERSRPFAVKKLTVLTPPPSAGDVLAAVRPYPTSFVLRGPDATLVRFNDAGAGAGLRILGYWRAGSFDLMVDRIDPLEPAEIGIPYKSERLQQGVPAP